jgi:hypothetical protein
MTRAVLAMLQGRILDGFLFNPLAGVVFAGLLVYSVGKFIFKKTLHVEATPGQRRALWIVCTFLVIGNWIYLIVSGK